MASSIQLNYESGKLQDTFSQVRLMNFPGLLFRISGKTFTEDEIAEATTEMPDFTYGGNGLFIYQNPA